MIRSHSVVAGFARIQVYQLTKSPRFFGYDEARDEGALNLGSFPGFVASSDVDARSSDVGDVVSVGAAAAFRLVVKLSLAFAL